MKRCWQRDYFKNLDLFKKGEDKQMKKDIDSRSLQEGSLTKEQSGKNNDFSTFKDKDFQQKKEKDSE